MSRLRKAVRTIGLGSAALTAGAMTYDVLSDSYAFSRCVRTLLCGVKILWGYKILFNENNYLDIHEGVAKSIYETCINNDGLYVKFGQGIATMDHLLPPPFFKHLSKLQDKAKPAPFLSVKQLLEAQIGQPIANIFSQFDQEPIASASIAQVHRARLLTGEEVAVKIQKPRVSKQYQFDLKMHYLVNFVLEYSFDLPLLQFVDDIHNNLVKELDFRTEAANAMRGKRDLERLGRTDFYIPKIYQNLTTERVMVSEWIDGTKVTDIIETKGNNNKLHQYRKQIMEKIISGFAQQIFVSGFIHCDPHPGNILIRDRRKPNQNTTNALDFRKDHIAHLNQLNNSQNNPKDYLIAPKTLTNAKNKLPYDIVLLDFGLCLAISDQFRLKYANFWKAMFLQEKSTMQDICRGWGFTNFSKQFASMQLMRPYTEKVLTKKVQKKDVMRMQAEAKQKMKEMMKQSQMFPKQLIFVGRNMNIVRSLNKQMGGLADRIPIMAKIAYAESMRHGGVYDYQAGVSKSISSKQTTSSHYYSIFTAIRFQLSLWLLELINWWQEIQNKKSLDDSFMEMESKKTQNMYIKYGFKPIDEKTYDA